MKIRKIMYDIENNLKENTGKHILVLYVLVFLSLVLELP